MSQTYISVVVMLLGTFLPKLGVTIGSDALTTTIQTIVVIGGAIWALVRRYQAGNVTVLGVRTN